MTPAKILPFDRNYQKYGETMRPRAEQSPGRGAGETSPSHVLADKGETIARLELGVEGVGDAEDGIVD